MYPYMSEEFTQSLLGNKILCLKKAVQRTLNVYTSALNVQMNLVENERVIHTLVIGKQETWVILKGL